MSDDDDDDLSIETISPSRDVDVDLISLLEDNDDRDVIMPRRSANSVRYGRRVTSGTVSSSASSRTSDIDSLNSPMKQSLDGNTSVSPFIPDIALNEVDKLTSINMGSRKTSARYGRRAESGIHRNNSITLRTPIASNKCISDEITDEIKNLNMSNNINNFENQFPSDINLILDGNVFRNIGENNTDLDFVMNDYLNVTNLTRGISNKSSRLTSSRQNITKNENQAENNITMIPSNKSQTVNRTEENSKIVMMRPFKSGRRPKSKTALQSKNSDKILEQYWSSLKDFNYKQKGRLRRKTEGIRIILNLHFDYFYSAFVEYVL